MKKQLICAALAFGTATTVGLAKDRNTRDRADQSAQPAAGQQQGDVPPGHRFAQREDAFGEGVVEREPHQLDPCVGDSQVAHDRRLRVLADGDDLLGRVDHPLEEPPLESSADGARSMPEGDRVVDDGGRWEAPERSLLVQEHGEVGPRKVEGVALAQKQPGIATLESACVRAFLPFRAPLNAAERERRLAAGLTPHQIELMDRWGYPYVLDQYRFHMTLTGPIPCAQREDILQHITRAYAPLAGDTHAIDAISVMRQDDGAGRFRVLERFPLEGG